MKALHAAADRLDPEVIRQRLDYWTLVVGPKFSKKDRSAINLRRLYSLNQVELCRNLIFRRHFPIHKIFERSCELGVFRLTADAITQIFGVRKHKRLRGKLHTMLEKVDHGHHVLRIYCKSLVARMYENVLVALLVPTHEHHALARRWVTSTGAVEGWATCPLRLRLSNHNRLEIRPSVA